MHKFLTVVFAFFFILLLRCVWGSNRLTATRQDVFEDCVCAEELAGRMMESRDKAPLLLTEGSQDTEPSRHAGV